MNKSFLEIFGIVIVVIIAVLILAKVVAILLSSLFVIAAFAIGYGLGYYRRGSREHRHDAAPPTE